MERVIRFLVSKRKVENVCKEDYLFIFKLLLSWVISLIMRLICFWSKIKYYMKISLINSVVRLLKLYKEYKKWFEKVKFMFF